MEKMILMIQNVLAMIAPSFKDAQSKVGVVETDEAVVAVNEISLLLVRRFKDGVDMGDFLAMWDKLQNDTEFKAKVAEGFDKYDKIPAEISDIDGGEGIELINRQISYLPSFLAEFKKVEVKLEVKPELPVEEKEELIEIK